MKSAAKNFRIPIFLGLTIVFWASAFAGIRAGLEEYSPGHVALVRLMVASIALLVYAAATRMPLPEMRDLPVILLGGFLAFTVYHVTLNYGEVTVTAGPASLLVNTAPIFTALLATAFLGERLRGIGWVGMFVSFVGAALIALGEGEGLRFAPGAFIILIAAVSVSIYLVIQKPYLKKYGSLNFTAYAIWAGTLFTLVFLPGLAGEVRSAPLDATLALVYLGIFPTAIAYVTYAYVFSQLTASRGVSFLYLVGPTAFVIAWIWLGEVPSLLSFIGAGIVLMGVAIVNTLGRAR
ncbi:MAG: DMT family transporter [Actinomycetota bacterium]|nr:DMT family transporter [Actinomycetota bacterium]HZY65488.1 DMT family transporter [Rubrobacteraceae bacterium]